MIKLLINGVIGIALLYLAYILLLKSGIKSLLSSYKEAMVTRKAAIKEARRIKKQTKIDKE